MEELREIPSQILTVPEVAERLGVSRQRVLQLIHERGPNGSRRLPAVKKGGVWITHTRALERPEVRDREPGRTWHK